MLISKDGSRHEDSYLLVVCSCLESGTNGYLCLSESHITTHQAVHRLLTLHICLHILCCFQLVRCIFIDEACLQLMLHIAVGTIGKTRLLLTLRVESNKIAGDILHLRLHTVFHPLPRTCTQSVQSWSLSFPTLVLRYFIECMNGHIYDVVILIENLDHLLHLPIGRHSYQSTKLTHTMIDMYHVVTHLKLLNLLQRECHLTSAGFIALEAILVITIEQLVIGEVTLFGFMVDKASMNGNRHRIEYHESTTLAVCIEDFLQTTYLLIVIGKDIECISVTQQLFKCTCHQFEILMEQRLHLSVERHLYIFVYIFCCDSARTSDDDTTTSGNIMQEFLLRRKKIRPSPFIPFLQGRGEVTIRCKHLVVSTPLTHREGLGVGLHLYLCLLRKTCLTNHPYLISHIVQVLGNNQRIVRQERQERYILILLLQEVRHDRCHLHLLVRQLTDDIERTDTIHFIAKEVDTIRILVAIRIHIHDTSSDGKLTRLIHIVGTYKPQVHQTVL